MYKYPGKKTNILDFPSDAFWLVCVALLWGATNPFIKIGSKGIENIKQNNAILQFFAEIKFLVLNYKYMVPFLLNQSGSVLYYLTLATVDLSLAVPLTNSLTFVFTALSGKLLNEKFGGKESYLGATCVALGILLCILSKLNT